MIIHDIEEKEVNIHNFTEFLKFLKHVNCKLELKWDVFLDEYSYTIFNPATGMVIKNLLPLIDEVSTLDFLCTDLQRAINEKPEYINNFFNMKGK